MAANPLAARSAPVAAKEPSPIAVHARLAEFAHSMPAHQLPRMSDLVGYVTPVLGKLASDPSVTSKDVVKAASQAVADGKVPASKAVEFLSTMPSDPDALRPWLKGLYAQNMTALVHLKAATMKNAPPAPVAAQGGPPAAPGPVAAPVAPAAGGAP